MEILKIWLYVEELSQVAAGNGAQVGNNYVSLSYDAAPVPNLPAGSGFIQSQAWLLDAVAGVSQPATNVIAVGQSGTWSAAQPTGAPVSMGQDAWHETDLTDSAGHGVIVGAQLFNLRQYVRWDLTAPGSTGQGLVGARILYRIKGVPYDDWVRQFTFGV